MSDQPTPNTPPEQPTGKKAYEPPRLQVHGSVADLTQIGGAGTADKSQGSVADL